MTLFSTPTDSGADPYDPAVGMSAPARRPRPRPGLVAGWVLLSAGVIGAVVLANLPSPYVVERPGPVFNTLGEVTSGSDKVPLIEIPDEKTYTTTGSLNLLTINIIGSPGDRLRWIDVALSWFDSSRAVVPIEQIYPPGTTDAESAEQSKVEMDTSQQEAVAASLRHLGYTVPGVVTVAQIVDGAPADGQLVVGDEILTADGTAVQDVTALREIIGSHGTDSAVELGIRRDGVEKDVSITPQLSEPAEDGTRSPIVGILTGSNYDFPVDVKIQLDNVGGPSAGMMFALGIIDKLTPGAMTGGEDIAGTGTIQADGTVGPIGGIRQKMYGAVGAGADWFLAPAENCDEVTGHIPDGLTVYSVATLDDAITAVTAIGDDDRATEKTLATCPAG